MAGRIPHGAGDRGSATFPSEDNLKGRRIPFRCGASVGCTIGAQLNMDRGGVRELVGACSACIEELDRQPTLGRGHKGAGNGLDDLPCAVRSRASPEIPCGTAAIERQLRATTDSHGGANHHRHRGRIREGNAYRSSIGPLGHPW